MRLRIQINRQISRVELPGEGPTVADLRLHVQEILLPSLGLRPDTEFTLSLNGREPLVVSDDTVLQTLSSCGIVSGDLICVLLSTASSPPPAPSVSSSSVTCSSHSPPRQHRRTNTTHAAPSSGEPSSSSSSSGQSTSHAQDVPAGTPERPTLPAIAPTWEPVLCMEAEEGKAPRCLEVLHHGAQSSGPADCLMVAVHLLMLESGFVVPHGSSDSGPGGETTTMTMPAGWRKAGGAYRLNYTHPLCEDSLVMLNAVSMGAKLIINATLKIETVGTTVPMGKLSLTPASFVSAEWAGPSAAAAFTHLRALSRTFKDQLVFPLIAAARDAMALPAAFGLDALSPEVLLPILRLLDVQSLAALSAVNRRFRCVAADNPLWRHLYRRDFGERDGSSRDTDWKELYKRNYAARRARPRVRPRVQPNRPSPYFPFNIPDPDPFRNPPYFPFREPNPFPHPRRHNSIRLLTCQSCQSELPGGVFPGRRGSTTIYYGGRVRRGGDMVHGHDKEKNLDDDTPL